MQKLTYVCALALLLVGCGAGGMQEEATAAEQIKAFSVDARELGYDVQAKMMADGHITESEYRQAYADTIECFKRAGLNVELIEVVTVHGFDFTFYREPTDADCEERFAGYLNGAWNVQYADVLTPEARMVAVSCYKREGTTTVGATTLNDFRELDESLLIPCMTEAAQAVTTNGETILTW